MYTREKREVIKEVGEEKRVDDEEKNRRIVVGQ